ncbi:uncharacterized protein [Macrobrachium rosenbergii]|uniref:uncharacterized protein n=1 Tax=Macrobrachium rosenbergii TaxID=79674 RepID=UPI0034D66B60
MAETLWCFIGCFFFGSYLILFAGLGLLIGSGSLRGGFALVFLGGILATTSTFVTCAAYWFRHKRTGTNAVEDAEDLPPSYRSSWERSFLGRTFSRNQGSSRHQMMLEERPDDRMSYRTQPPHNYTNFAMVTNDEGSEVAGLPCNYNDQYGMVPSAESHLNPKFMDAPPSYDEVMAAKGNS